jgi:hypothetical protein
MNYFVRRKFSNPQYFKDGLIPVAEEPNNDVHSKSNIFLLTTLSDKLAINRYNDVVKLQ